MRTLTSIMLTLSLGFSSLSWSADNSTNSNAGKCGFRLRTLNDSLLVDIGPLKINVTPSNAREIRSQHSAAYDDFYVSAKQFAKIYGNSFAQLALSRIHEKKATVLVALGGAEHLGTLLQIYAKVTDDKHSIDFKFVNLSTAVVKPWYGYNGDFRISGIGPVPEGAELSEANISNPEELRAYLKPENLFSNPNLVVVDTAYRGTIPEAVAYVGRLENFQGTVEGVLLYHGGNVHHTIPVVGLNQISEHRSLQVVADQIDNNGIRGGAYQRSFSHAGNIGDSPALMSHYKSTLLGLYDGIVEALYPAP